MSALLLVPMFSALMQLYRPSRFAMLISFSLSLFLSLLFLIEPSASIELGGWRAPFGILLRLDLLSALFLFAVNAVFLASALSIREEKSRFTPALLLFLQMGVTLTLVTADFFNLFVAFEILLTASYSLFFVEAKEEKLKRLYPYILLNLVGSFLFLAAAALLYGRTGHLNMDALRESLLHSGGDPSTLTFAFLMLAVIALKAALVPLHYWLPASYPTLPAPIAALFGGVLSKVPFYVLIRLLVDVLPHDLLYLKEALLPVALVSMVIGVLGAASKESVKEILSYHIVSQVGYIALAISLFTPLSIAAALLFTLHNIFVKSSLFLATGENDIGKGTIHSPLLGALFLIQALSLAGVPPLSGFFGKLFLFEECLRGQYLLSFFIGVATSWFTLYSMIKIYSALFLGEKEMTKNVKSTPVSGLILLTLLSLFLGVGAPLTLPFVTRAAEQLFEEVK